MSLLLAALSTLLGCSTADSEPRAELSVQAPAVEAGSAALPVLAKPAPLRDKTRAEICTTDALLLIKYPIGQLENTGWTTFCCGADPVYDDGRCELDWPSSDVPDCSIWDELRNQVYARHGYPFTSKKWQAWATAQSWYERREDFSEGWLSAAARSNIETLKRYAKSRHNCG